MGISIGTQTISITAAALAGLSAGLLYDLLRQIRAATGKAAGLICDVLFCLYCTAALFLIGMFFCEGRLGVWEPAGFLAAFGLYLFGISPSVAPVFGICAKKIRFFLKKAAKK
ncbi:MAG: hypothetical protein IJS79_05635 [Oscillospiraceae bacterium]|nr:hypothetical protein [Oscillospiraceae bacterium]